MAERTTAVQAAPRCRDDILLSHRSCRVVSRSLATNHAIHSVAGAIITTTRSMVMIEASRPHGPDGRRLDARTTIARSSLARTVLCVLLRRQSSIIVIIMWLGA